ncbi:MAG: nucleotidyltransferase family protein, partial [Ruminococcus sp.]|nr:nucleotidyltransferase family protein [Ruminococcus sp.]
VEYIRALEGTEIRPLPIMRQGAAHDSDKTSGGFASASYIRSLLREGKECAELLPEIPRQVTRPGLLDRAVLYRLRTMTAEELRALPEVGEGLENRILDAAGRAQSVEELLTMVKTKRYTHARLRRILACAFLGLTEELQTTPAGYARILGFTDEGEQILRSCTCKIITSAAKALRENDENTLHLSLDVRACDIAALAYDEIMPSNSDYCTRILRENREK